MRSLAVFGLGVLALGAALWGLLSQFDLAPPETQPDRLTFQPTDFSALAGWNDDQHGPAVSAFLRSCERWRSRPRDRSIFSSRPEFGTVGQWVAVCTAAEQVPHDSDQAARLFFEAHFRPFAASNNEAAEGLFTGYFEPELRGSPIKTGPFTVPLYQRPGDLISVDLGEFRADLKGRRVAGRIEGNRLRPYASRAEIERAPSPAHDPLVWVDDAVDAFFLHIQGSGRIVFPDGQVMRVGYAAQNGHPYTAIGRVLVQDGHLALEEVTMQSIRLWLDDNPDQAADLMNENDSYVYFRKIDLDDADLGPIGAHSVPLTTGRSLAVDRKHWPLGLPLWLDTDWPAESVQGGSETPPAEAAPVGDPLRRLMVAQDTGGAIRGPIRGDVFLGFGDEAGDIAGRMKQTGTLVVLLPVSVVEANQNPS